MYKTTLLPPESQHNPPSPPSWFILMFQRMHTHTHSPIRKPPLQSPLSSHTHTSAPLPLRCIQSVATGGGAAHTVNPSSRGLRLGRDPEITGLASWRTVHAVILFYTATQVKCCSDKGSSNQTGGLLFISPGSCARHVPESRNKNQSIRQLIGFIFPVRSQKETPALLCPVQTAAPERRWRHIRTEPPPPHVTGMAGQRYAGNEMKNQATCSIVLWSGQRFEPRRCDTSDDKWLHRNYNYCKMMDGTYRVWKCERVAGKVE